MVIATSHLNSLLKKAARACTIIALLVVVAYNILLDNGVSVQLMKADAGPVRRGTEILVLVRIMNASLLPVRLSIVPECGCTDVNKPNIYLQPLSVCTVRTTIHTDGMRSGNGHRGLELAFDNGRSSWFRRVEERYFIVKGNNVSKS
jgi:hypothetical protein